jgi:hypothetical protein
MTTRDTPIEEEAQLDYDQEPEDDWLEEPEEPPRRPRRKLLAPVPAALLVVLLIAGAFFAGVEVEKGQSSTPMSSGFPAGLAALRGAGGGSSSSTRTTSGGGGGAFAGGGGFPGASGLSGGLTTGEVSYVSGNTLYVNSGENTVKVSAPTGTKVSKTVSTSVHSIHPGDTVIVRGSQSGKGSVTASSISISSAGSGSGTSSSGGSSSTGASQQLFGSG